MDATSWQGAPDVQRAARAKIPCCPFSFGERPADPPSPLSPRTEQPRKETDMSDFETTYARHKELCAKTNELNKAVLFDALAPAGITTIHVEFDGEGDSGQINGISA